MAKTGFQARTGMILPCLVLAVALGCGSGTDPDDERFEKAKATLEQSGPEAVVAELFATNDPVDATRAVHRLVLHLYWTNKDLESCILVGRTGLAAATEAAKAAPDRAPEVRRLVFEISSSLAFYTWPGWGHKGIRIRRAELEVGQRAARYALTVARDLELPDERRARAYWLVGAHMMLTGERNLTVEAFTEARRLGDDHFRSFVRGTMAIGAARLTGADAMTRDLFDSALRDLEVAGGEEGERFIQQLNLAWRILVPEARGRSPSVSVEAGPVTLEIVAGRAALHFAVVSQLARGLIPEDAFPLGDEDRERLDRFAGLVSRKPDLRGFFFTSEAPTAALFDAAGAGRLTPKEVTELSAMFVALASRIDAHLVGRRLAGKTFAAALDRKRIEEVVARASKFTTVETLTVEVWPIPAEPGKPRGRFEGGRIVVEVDRSADPTDDLVYGIAQAFLAERAEDIRPAWEKIESQVGKGLSAELFIEAIGALLVEGGEAADARNVRGPLLLDAVRLVMEIDGRSLVWDDPDPLAAFLRRGLTEKTIAEPK